MADKEGLYGNAGMPEPGKIVNAEQIKLPVMTRRGVIMCDISVPDGYIMLPQWVEATDIFRDGNGQVRVDVSQNSGYTIVASVDSKGHIQLPKGYSVVPKDYNSAGEPHDLDLIVTDYNATPRPIIKCKGGIDARPGLEEMARLIRENERLTAKVAELEVSNRQRGNQLKLWSQAEASRRNQLQVQGLFGPNTKPHD